MISSFTKPQKWIISRNCRTELQTPLTKQQLQFIREQPGLKVRHWEGFSKILSQNFIAKRIAHFYNHFGVVSLRQTLDQQVYDRLRHQLFNFLSEQNKIMKDEQEADRLKQIVQLTYPYQYGPRLEFEQQCRQLLTHQLASRLKIDPAKLKIVLQTKQQYSLNGLLSQQKPSNELV